MTSEITPEVLGWLHTLPNKDLQKLSIEANTILMVRYDKELEQSKEYQVNMAVALYLLGQRQTKDVIQCIISKLEKSSGTYLSFDDLITKLKRKLPND